MKKKRNLILLIIIVISLTNCDNNLVRQYLAKVNSHLNELKKTFGADYLKSDLLSHFPEKIIDTTSFSLFSSPPASPPAYECQGHQYGYVYLIKKRDSLIEKDLTNNYKFKTLYIIDENIIIDQPELHRKLFPVNKCNKAFENKFPIPYFESFDFNLGGKQFEKEMDGEKHWNYINTIPADLEVYVLESEPGDYWKENCNEYRPETLKEWDHGYSKGIAISKEKDLITYWTMVW